MTNKTKQGAKACGHPHCHERLPLAVYQRFGKLGLCRILAKYCPVKANTYPGNRISLHVQKGRERYAEQESNRKEK